MPQLLQLHCGPAHQLRILLHLVFAFPFSMSTFWSLCCQFVVFCVCACVCFFMCYFDLSCAKNWAGCTVNRYSLPLLRSLVLFLIAMSEGKDFRRLLMQGKVVSEPPACSPRQPPCPGEACRLQEQPFLIVMGNCRPLSLFYFFLRHILW